MSQQQAIKVSAGGVKKARAVGTKIITANDLFGGHAIYLTHRGGWSARIEDAAILEGEDALAALGRAVADEAASVGPYLMDAGEDAAPAGRGRLRETIRRDGPTVSLPTDLIGGHAHVSL